MGQIVQVIANLFRHHKLKILAVLAFALLFFAILFPRTDLADLITAQIVRATGIYVQFDELDFDLLPAPGFDAQEIRIEPRGVPPLKAESLEASLALSKLLGLKLGANVSITDIFKGDLDIAYSQGAKTSAGTRREDVTLRADSVDLEALSRYLRDAGVLPMKLEGQVNTSVVASVDPEFAEQPKGELSLEAAKFSLPGQSITVNFNGVPVQQELPPLNLGRVNLKGVKLNDGVLEIQEATIGDNKSDVKGKIKGTLSLRFKKGPGGVLPEMTKADFEMDLNVDKGFLERNQKSVIGGFLILIPPNAKHETPTGTRLAFRMRINRPGEMPTFTPL